MNNEKKIKIVLALMMLIMSAFIVHKTLDFGPAFGWSTRKTYAILVGVEILYLAMYTWQSHVLLQKLRKIWRAEE
jgi:hypothetical protein